MIEFLPSSPKLAAFLAASLVLAIVPGPGVVYLTTQTLAHGRCAGFASVGGVALGNLGSAVAASLGLAALLAFSATVFFAVKLAGAAYLVFLGIKSLRRSAQSGAGERARGVRPTLLLRDGAVVALLNPKTALFYGAFLPQFVDPAAGSPLAETLLLAALFVIIAVVTDSIYVYMASALSTAAGSRARWGSIGRYAAAGTLVGLGVYAALSSSKLSK